MAMGCLYWVLITRPIRKTLVRTKVTLVLDNDASAKAVSITRKCNLIDHVRLTKKDLKWLTGTNRSSPTVKSRYAWRWLRKRYNGNITVRLLSFFLSSDLLVWALLFTGKKNSDCRIPLASPCLSL